MRKTFCYTTPMEITKLGHCCLRISIDGVTVLTDPGTFSSAQDEVRGIDLILITHEHADHLHVESLKRVLGNNPEAKVITNTAVGKILDGERIAHEILEGTSASTYAGIAIEACDGKHEEIFEDLGQVQNTGYFIANQFFYPGDSFKEPGKPVDVLALPVAGPWCKISDAIRYALRVKPRIAFPVHDAVLKNPALGSFAPGKVLPEHGIAFVPLLEGETKTF
jgi:L-ascorbate metabolism protein UlaG (beta-lactamase superfamily)